MADLDYSIESQDDAMRYVREHPNEAQGLVLWNMVQMKHQCSCRLEECKKRMKITRAKNLTIQSATGFLGGFFAWLAMKLGVGGP